MNVVSSTEESAVKTAPAQLELSCGSLVASRVVIPKFWPDLDTTAGEAEYARRRAIVADNLPFAIVKEMPVSNNWTMMVTKAIMAGIPRWDGVDEKSRREFWMGGSERSDYGGIWMNLFTRAYMERHIAKWWNKLVMSLISHNFVPLGHQNAIYILCKLDAGVASRAHVPARICGFKWHTHLSKRPT